jgi:hypothetical protein
LFAGLARAYESANKIKIITDYDFVDRTLTKTAIYNMTKKVKASKTTDNQWHLNRLKMKRTLDIMATVAAGVKADRCVTYNGSCYCPWMVLWHHAQYPA